MSTKLNETEYYNFKKLLERFCGDNKIIRMTQEVTNRHIFATNIMQVLSDVELTDENVKLLNNFITGINNYDIALTFLYEICGTKEITVDTLLGYIEVLTKYDVCGKIDNNIINKILISLEHTENKALLDINGLIKNVYCEDRKVYYVPKIEYSYIKNDTSFINKMDVLKDFYTNTRGTNIKNAVFAKSPSDFTNDELRLFITNLQTSFDNKDFALLKFGYNSPYNDMLTFVHNFSRDYISTGYTDYAKKCKKLLTTTIFIGDLPELDKQLIKDLYKPYLYDIISYVTRELEFNMETYLPKLEHKNVKDITVDSYKYELMKAYITGSYNDILDYANQVIIMQDYLTNIKNVILTSNKYTMEE